MLDKEEEPDLGWSESKEGVAIEKYSEENARSKKVNSNSEQETNVEVTMSMADVVYVVGAGK